MEGSRSRRRLPLTALIALLAVLVGVLPTGSVSSQSSDGSGGQTTRERRDAVRREAAANAANINATEASISDAQAALDALDANIAGQQSALADAQNAVDAAQQAVVVANQRVADIEAEIAQLAADLKTIAVNQYVEPRQGGGLVDILTLQDPQASITLDVLFDVRAGSVVGDADRASSLSEDLALARAAAERAQLDAQAREADEADQLVALQDAQIQQQQVADDLAQRLDRAEREAENLQALDAQLSAQYQREQEELARRLAEAREAQRRADEAAAEAARRRNQAPAAPRAPTSSSSSRGSVVSRDQTTVVYDVRVHVDIADAYRRMIEAAASDGITLRGGGYRDAEGQIAVRMNNCGTSDYAIYDMPASQCSPPTARPGNSEHERGRAIDFNCNGGGVISSRSNPCFQWLASNAANFGFYNLPSEPWHWSTSGR
jgi:septal ring factor EnvC (AmiA/AmiB activator)